MAKKKTERKFGPSNEKPQPVSTELEGIMEWGQGYRNGTSGVQKQNNQCTNRAYQTQGQQRPLGTGWKNRQNEEGQCRNIQATAYRLRNINIKQEKELTIQEDEASLILPASGNGAEVTCISEEFVNKNAGGFRNWPSLPISGFSVKGPTGGKPVRVKKQLFIDVQLPTCMIQMLFMVVTTLSRPCIIDIDILDQLRTEIDIDVKELVFFFIKRSIFYKNCESPTKKATCFL